ncbi:hypothetical protein BJ742DRAFT_741252 [Cladochytrium replicatum]|nr:hypothetical protein BJ742DRAFT_741252 [Cladochytrium replicatum]
MQKHAFSGGHKICHKKLAAIKFAVGSLLSKGIDFLSSTTESGHPTKAPALCEPPHGRMTGGAGGVLLTWAYGNSTVRGSMLDIGAENCTHHEAEFGEDEKMEFALDRWETVGSGVPIGARVRSADGIDTFGLLFFGSGE